MKGALVVVRPDGEVAAGIACKILGGKARAVPLRTATGIGERVAMRMQRTIGRLSFAVAAASGMACDGTEPGVYLIEIAPASAGMSVGETRQFIATALTASGGELPDAAITWRSSNEFVASSSPVGALTGISPGRVYVIATHGNIADSAEVFISYSNAPVASVSVRPIDSVAVEVGAPVVLTAVLRGANNEVLVDRPITWMSEDATRVEVNGFGRVMAVKAGRVAISATSEGKTGSTLVVATQPPRDFAVRDAQMTQATQNAGHTVPMVAGRAAAVNVQLTAAPFKNILMEVALRLTDDAGAVLHEESRISSGAPGINASFASPDPQFLVPGEFVREGVYWQVIRDPRGRVGDDNASNDAFPPDGPRAIAAMNVPPLKIHFVPIRLDAHGGVTGPVSQASAPNYLFGVRSMLPVGVIETSVGAPLPTDAPFGSGGASFWSDVLADLDLARALDATVDEETYWYGVVPMPQFGTFYPDILTGMGYVPSDPRETGAGVRSAVGIQAGWSGYQQHVVLAVAHELSHNFGRAHAPCAPTVVDSDPLYPHLNGSIGVMGHDVRIWADGFQPPLGIAPTTIDIMGPCGAPRWISDYTFVGVLNARGLSTGAAALSASGRVAAARARTERVLVIRGRVRGDRVTRLDPPFITNARPSVKRDGPFRVTMRANDGRVLHSVSFTAASVGHGSSERHFLQLVPLSRELEAELAVIEASGATGATKREFIAPTSR